MSSLAGHAPSTTFSPGATSPMATAKARTRLIAIDALRGLVMLFMLVDHVRETFFLYMQVTDPVDANTTDPGLFYTRLLSTFCAPTFVALTGLSAWLYGQSHSKGQVSEFLLKRGLFLIVLEFTVVGYAWPTQAPAFPPTAIWLQVIWAIGISMIALAALLHLPRVAQFAVGVAIVCLHNLLDPIRLTADQPGYVAWAILHQRSLIEFGGIAVKTTYPILPWIGVILLGYACGPWFAKGSDPQRRIRRLLMTGLGLVLGFILIRYLNVYGDKPWFVGENPTRTVMSFLALTKYPPSLLFLMPTVGTGCLLLALFEKFENSRVMPHLALLGGAPMFYYVLHLYVLKLIYNVALMIYGPNKGTVFGVDNLSTVWIWVALLILPLYYPTRWFAQLKQRRKDIWWLKYL
ncbi:putative membrane protein [Sphingobium xenophagum]|uniref:Membrane protein n=1 Tax=Sphingobium xenophagum TaxID=121428 RepID=A0ABU1X3S2_SPHXE|nr:heparan-alpha-glucosaminide N-acetyltransferase domain-containing protein [Sphingobium xenophagum]MDR7156215.1 putative membrane protein [Sphingobium xenophagum]